MELEFFIGGAILIDFGMVAAIFIISAACCCCCCGCFCSCYGFCNLYNTAKLIVPNSSDSRVKRRGIASNMGLYFYQLVSLGLNSKLFFDMLYGNLLYDPIIRNKHVIQSIVSFSLLGLSITYTQWCCF